MTPKEKAQELFMRNFEITVDDYCSKQCALIAVEFAREFITGDLNEQFDKFIYLQDIKQEIEKL